MCQCVTMHCQLVTILFCLMCWGFCVVSDISDAWTHMDWPIGAERLEDRSAIGGLVMDWRISQGLAGWSEIGNIHILLCKCSSRIGIRLTLNWQIGLGLVNWLRIARWSVNACRCTSKRWQSSFDRFVEGSIVEWLMWCLADHGLALDLKTSADWRWFGVYVQV